MKKIFIIFFIFFIFTPIIGLLFNIQDGLENTEKRNMPQFPKFSNLNSFIDDFLEYYENNFGFRYSLMKFASNFKIKLFKTYPKNIDLKVLKGKDGWLFYKLGNETEDFEGRVLFSDAMLNRIKQNCNNRIKNLAPAKFYILVPPDKTVIYPEFLPDSILAKENMQKSRINQLLGENVEIIYPKDVILENKNHELLYYKTDTHWTYYGAYFGYLELMNQISLDFSVKALKFSSFVKQEYEFYNPDLANIINIGTRQSEKSYKYECTENVEKSNLKVVIFGDSFLEYLEPYLKCTFKDIKIVYSNTIDANLVKNFKPNIVILEIVQRNIRQLEIKDKI